MFIRLLALLGVIGGGATLVWFGGLTSEEQQEAERLARENFGKAAKRLTSSEAMQIKNRQTD